MSFDESSAPGGSGTEADGTRGEGNPGGGGDPGGGGGRGERGERAGGTAQRPGAADEKKDGAGEGQGEGSGKPRSRMPLFILAGVVIVLAIVGFIVWFAHRNQVSTDDAYTDGNTVTMAPKVSGYVVALFINDNMHVRKGDLLLRIEPADYLAARSQAEAQLALARAQLQSAQTAVRIARVQYPAQYSAAMAQRRSAAAVLAQAQAQYLREHEVDRRATTQESIDASTSQKLSSSGSLQSAEAQVAIARLAPQQIEQAVSAVAEREAAVRQAQAQLDQANLNLGYTEIRAPVDGFVTMRSVQLGSYATAGQSLFLLVTADVWVTANFKESQIGRMRIGDSVDLEVDAYSGYRLHGHVQSIQYGSGSKFSAFPAENATGNFVKIVQRIPVKIVIDRGLDPDRPLPLGLSVTPTVYFP
jgi:membrane fusion protein (multidrug efflux system)